METNQDSLNDSTNKEVCCNEQKLWIQLMNHWKTPAKWFLLVAAVFIIGLFITGLLADPDIIRILWLSVTGLILAVVLPMIIFIWKRVEQCNEKCESDNS